MRLATIAARGGNRLLAAYIRSAARGASPLEAAAELTDAAMVPEPMGFSDPFNLAM